MSKNRKRVRHDETEDTAAEIHSRHRDDEVPPDERGAAGSGAGDRHAAGAPMGGSAVGGLEGTNVGDGSPENANIDAAQGSDEFERRLDSDQEAAYAGKSGGAVGGTPANKRATGGRSGEE